MVCGNVYLRWKYIIFKEIKCYKRILWKVDIKLVVNKGYVNDVFDKLYE